MRELLVRTISGLIYMTLILFAMYADAQYYLLLTACFGLLTLFEFQRLVQIKSLLPYAIFVLLFVGIHQDIFPEWMDLVIGVLGVLMNTYLILNLLEFISHQRLERKYILMVFYIMIGVITMGLIPQISGDYDMNLIAGVFILIWVNDSMAYLVGVNFGRHKLLEHISPKKTVEGTLGGRDRRLDRRRNHGPIFRWTKSSVVACSRLIDLCFWDTWRFSSIKIQKKGPSQGQWCPIAWPWRHIRPSG